MHRALMFGLIAAIAGCGDGNKGIQGDQAPAIEVREGDQLIPRSATVVIADGGSRTIRVENTGNADLVIKGVTVSGDAAAFPIAATPMPSAAAPVTLAPDATWTMTISYDAAKAPPEARPKATIVIATNTTIPDGLTEFTFYAAPETITSKLVLQPPIVDFETVEAQTTSTKPLNVLNTGAAPLTINRVTLTGDPGYTAVIDGKTLKSGEATDLAMHLELAPSSAVHVDITFAAAGPGPANAELKLFSDDPGATAGTAARLFANLAGPCVRAVPARIDFGAKIVGQTATTTLQLESCGDRDVEVSSIALADDGDGVFAIDTSGAALPKTLAPGARMSLPVTYTAAAYAALGSDGQYVRDQGRVRIASNAYFQAIEVELSGFGSGTDCPLAVIDLPEGNEVLAQTELHLSALSSTSPSGQIKRWEWSVIQPAGSVSTFQPSAQVREPTFVPNIVGTYIFRLEVFDEHDQKSCAPAEYVVEVASDDAIHVELLWRTPGDIDETDEGGGPTFSWGSDVDLHFLYPFAVLLRRRLRLLLAHPAARVAAGRA